MVNYFRVLGVGPKSTRAHIKAAYRKLALEHHPDTHFQSAEDTQEATIRFRLIAEAYKTLYDPGLRSEYTLALLMYAHEADCVLCNACGAINRLTRRLPDGKDYVCGVCREVITLSDEERERHRQPLERPKARPVVERLKVEARSVAGEMAMAALKAAARRYARKLS